jgi:hypothetical protein
MRKLEQEQQYTRAAMHKNEQLCASESKKAQVIGSTKKKKREKNTTYKSYKTKQNKKPKLELKITQNIKQLIF